MTETRKLRVFISCGLHDRPTVHILYRRLKDEGWIAPWLDDEDLLPGQNLELEIEKELESADVALICLSKESLDQEGYFQKEIDSLVEVAHKKLKGSVFIIPILLDDCELPRSLRSWLPIDFVSYDLREAGYQLLLKSLERKYEVVSDRTRKSKSSHWVFSNEQKDVDDLADLSFGGFTFVKIPKGKFKMGSRASNDLAGDDEHPQRRYDIPYNYWITRFPVSNEQFSEYAVSTRRIDALPKNWKKNLDQPIVNISWRDAVDYTKWLNKIFKNEISNGLVLRLPTEAEWEKASRGDLGAEYPWGNENLNDFLSSKKPELLVRLKKGKHIDENKFSSNFAEHLANVSGANSSEVGNDLEESLLDKIKLRLAELRKSMELPNIGTFSPIADSPYEVADMMGSIGEWTHSLYWSYPYDVDDGRENPEDPGERAIRGAFLSNNERFSVRSAKRSSAMPDRKGLYLGLRIVVAPPVS